MIRKINKHQFSVLLAAFALVVVTIVSCNVEDELPPNPYDGIDYPTPSAPTDTLNPNGIIAIHRDILHPRCAVPGCHDGHFEPDFRTVQSASSTTVYARIAKNNADSTFAFRVVPYDTAQSALHERITNCCFANVNDRMPQDNIGVPLESEYVSRIENWILNGAQNMFGQVAELPNQAPQVAYFAAVDTFELNAVITAANAEFPLSAAGNRIDGVYYNPFVLQANQNFAMLIAIEDDSTALADLQVNKLKFSYEADNFSPSASGYYEQTAQFFSIPGFEIWYVELNASIFNPNEVVYMRYYVSDGESETEMPRDDMVIQLKTFWSFYTLP
ncbi:MAG: hypothetical protein ACPGU4_12540 [Flavobacteriales bacterium]